ncbi:MAG TPA: folylpolyglutamate synthase/dihydrofolate synthase family protein [Nitrospiria bacterium]|nr:folylpolyglutamate synthase/dihydrofolate synthase family protein [Nitrospiria bacterium]
MAKPVVSDPLQWLARFDHSLIKPGLGRVLRLLEAFGHPHRRWPSVHVAGTNGKGSTAAMIAAMLQAAGYRVGLYTSPHLHTVNERMRVNGAPIPADRLAGLAEELRAALRRLGLRDVGPSPATPHPVTDLPTYFECTTAIAFAYFTRERVDWAVVETGLGGRFDATNVVMSRVSVLTPIDYDHTDYLGPSLASIAWEKAGIIKAGVPVVMAPQEPEVRSVLDEEARLQSAPVIRHGRDFSVEPAVQLDGGPQRFTYRDREWTLPDLACPLLGRHQLLNASSAIAAVAALRREGVPMTPETVSRGLASVRWEGRLEVMKERPRLILDGAHNPAAARALAAYLSEEKRRLGGSVTLIFGIMRDKAVVEVVAALRPVVDRWVAVSPETPRALSPERVAAVIEAAGGSVTMASDPGRAVSATLSTLSPDDLCCVTGSFYTVAAARESLLCASAS